MSTRVRSMKKGIKGDESRRKRQDKAVSIRKNKRKQQLLKRRNTSRSEVNSAAPIPTGPASTDELSTIARTIFQVDQTRRFEMTQKVRRMLSKEEAPPVQPVIQAGLVPVLVQLLKLIQEPKTQFEAAWALTNIASTEHTRVIVTSGALGYLVKLMKSTNADVREQCLWCLGNVAGDGHDMRDLLLSNPASMANLLLNITHAASKSMIKNATWTLSNFCRGKPVPELAKIRSAFPILAKLITHEDSEVVGDACWALSYISDGSNDRIGAVMEVGVVPTLVRLLRSDKTSIVTPALRTIGNVVSGDDQQTQSVIDAGALESLEGLLTHTKRTIRKEACWTLSNIAAGLPRQVQCLLTRSSCIKTVLKILTEDDFDVRKEAAWVISNLCTGGQAHQIDAVVQLGAIESLCNAMDIDGENDVKVLLVVLEALNAILASSQASGRDYDQQVEDFEGLDRLEALQDHENEDVYNKAMSIIEKYFEGQEEDEAENENVAPDGQTFTFGAKPNAVKNDFGSFGCGPSQSTGLNTLASTALTVQQPNSDAFSWGL